MKEFLKEILADPITGQALMEENRDGKDFLSSDNNVYPVLENIPVLLPSREKKNTNSDLHSHFNSDFNYAVHYNEDANYFDYFKEEESRAGKEEIRRLHQAIIKRIPKNAELILDAGCGNGWVAKYFLGKGKKVVSMDISTKNPSKVLKANPGENHGAVVADAYHLPFKKNEFDAIIASEILEHVYDPKLFIIKLLEVLKPGGTLILSTPYNEKIEYYLCVHCNKPTPKNAHLHSFNEKNIVNFIPEEAGGFKMDKFSNKYLVRLRLNLLMSFLPFGLWKFKDAVANSIFKKPLRFLIELKKK
ncbi:MAG: methyltransferase domain-containing protein [Ginsengibacter sp.]